MYLLLDHVGTLFIPLGRLQPGIKVRRYCIYLAVLILWELWIVSGYTSSPVCLPHRLAFPEGVGMEKKEEEEVPGDQDREVRVRRKQGGEGGGEWGGGPRGGGEEKVRRRRGRRKRPGRRRVFSLQVSLFARLPEVKHNLLSRHDRCTMWERGCQVGGRHRALWSIGCTLLRAALTWRGQADLAASLPSVV